MYLHSTHTYSWSGAWLSIGTTFFILYFGIISWHLICVHATTTQGNLCLPYERFNPSDATNDNSGSENTSVGRCNPLLLYAKYFWLPTVEFASYHGKKKRPFSSMIILEKSLWKFKY
jgi:hypothetical protein